MKPKQTIKRLETVLKTVARRSCSAKNRAYSSDCGSSGCGQHGHH